MKKYFIVCASLLIAACIIFLPTEKNSSREKFHENENDAMDALHFITTAAAYPNADIPADAYVQAMQYYKNLQSSKQLNSTSPWSSIGPVNMGGRTLCIALNPNDTSEIWLGSASGGLWKSNSGGIGTNAWTFVPTGFGVLGVSSIAFNPQNPNEMIIGTGETYLTSNTTYGIVDRTTRGTFGMGMYKTTNHGATWTQVLNWTYNQNRGVWDIVYNPLKPTTVYAATTEGIYKSVDGGNSWNQNLAISMAMDLEIHNVDTNIILCGVGNLPSTSHGIYRTTNSGTVWTQLITGLPPAPYAGRITLAKYPTNNDTMFAHICDVYNSIGTYKSSDKGLTWVQQTNQDIGGYQGWYCSGLVVQPGNQNNILAGGISVYGSTDNALSFATLSTYLNNLPTDAHPDVHDIEINPLDANKTYFATDGGLFRSNDFGQTYYECTGGYTTLQMYIGAVSQIDSTIMIMGAQDNFTNKYFGNNIWHYVIGGDGCYTAIDPTDDNVQYGAYQFLNVYQSTDQGNSFWAQILNYPSSAAGNNPAAFLAPYILCPSNTQRIYAGEQSLQRSDDGGGSFFPQGNSPVNNGAYILTIAVSSSNQDSVYFATAPNATDSMKVFFSTDGGATVTDVSAGLPNRYPRRIAVDPGNSKIAYIVFSGFGTGHVFKTINAGATWTDISPPVNLPFHCVTVDPLYPNNIYVGCDFGIFYSTDGGQTWATWDTGFPDITMVFDLQISPQGREMLAFTHGRGVYKRPLESSSVGIKENKKENNFILYPNPAKGILNVSAGENNSVFSIFSLEGKLLMNLKVGIGTNTIDISALADGYYIASLQKGNAVSTRRFIKNSK